MHDQCRARIARKDLEEHSRCHNSELDVESPTVEEVEGKVSSRLACFSWGHSLYYILNYFRRGLLNQALSERC